MAIGVCVMAARIAPGIFTGRTRSALRSSFATGQASGGMDGLDDLERWAADARAREAADARVRERWLRAQAEDGANLAGLLLALAERRETVVVTTTAAAGHRGVVTGVGVDFVALAVPAAV